MSFTDDDLKQIKKEAEALGGERFRALIARLEAAEKALTAECECDGFCTDKCAETDALDAWRKAAGK